MLTLGFLSTDFKPKAARAFAVSWLGSFAANHNLLRIEMS